MTNIRKLVLGYPGGGTGTHEPFDAVFPKAVQCTPTMIKDGMIDALVVWGGGDISPSIYNQKPSLYTQAKAELSRQDEKEVALMEAAILTGTPIIGVCRGAQMLCAMAGGSLVQHVTGHHSDHAITTDTGRSINTSSVHHQMLFPWDVDHKLLAWASKPMSSTYIGEDSQTIGAAAQHPEPEIVFFPQVKGLAIQGHPEFMHSNDEFVVYCNDLVRQYLLEETA